MRRDIFVYISGPMTAKDGHTTMDNVADGAAIYWDLLLKGIPAFCPHLSGAFPAAWTLMSHERWIAYDYAVIDRCTHVLMMPRWETSAGARLEYAYAMSAGKVVVFSTDELS